MNGLTLRINKGGGRKSKTSLGFAAVDVSKFISETLVKKKNNNFYKFTHASSADEQLTVLKIIVDEITTTETGKFDEKETLKFLSAVFFHAEVKHPVKCFLSRHITKNNKLQQPFTDSLAEQIVVSISDQVTSYKNYVAVVSKLVCCIENFPAGSAAVKKEEVRLTEYLDGCLKCCVQTLRTKTSLSPTEKNEIFNLAHLALRLLLYITQKISPNVVVPTSAKFPSIRRSMQDLLFDEDVPMDTKSVCGILYLTMHVLENGSDSWVEILQLNTKDDTIRCLLSNEASQLSLYSAIATAVAMDRLQSQIVDGKPALVTLNQRILSIGERSSSESIFMLGVTRTLVQISKGLDKLTDSSLGRILVGDLLSFVWAHLEHYMDSVRHLTAQILGNIVRYCSKLDREGDPTALTNLFSTLTSLDKGRKSYYVSLTSLVNEIGASEVLRRLPSIIRDTLPSLSVQAVQASATTYLETLLQKHVKESNTATIYREWIDPVLQHVASHTLDSGALNILENLMARAVKLDENVINYILPHMKRPTTELKCVLMLLSVARKSGVTGKLASGHDEEWKGIISYDVLDMAAVDAVDETRILSLSLVVESPKTTEVFSRRELAFVLHYLKYNANAQSPNFRQLTLSIFKKSFRQGQVDIEFTFFVMVGGCVFCAFPCFYGDILMSKSEELQLALYECGWESVWERRVRSSLLLMMTRTSRAVAIRTVFRTISLEALADFIKRLEDSYKVLKKQQGSEEYYTGFVDELRALCFNSLIPGANYSRRVVALQVLLWTEQIHMDGYDRIWNEDYGEKLLVHLEDSYENNKAFALEILNKCPVSLITSKRYSISLEIEDILRQASSMKPTDCVSAAYKLDLLRSKLPEKIPQENSNNISEAVTFSLLQRLHTELLAELATCARSIVSAAINAPMYGLLHCMVHLITKIDTRAISANKEWSVLVSDIIDTCFRVNASVACVVNNSSPEGHLPMDMGGVEVTDHGNSGGVRLEDGRQVTAQMVLLCAWRSVKEVSLLLGEISSRLTITGEDGDGTLTPALMILIGEHFTKLLAETKHRGAFEQAYVGFTKLLARLWRCRTASLHELPSGWLRELMAAIATGDRRGMLCATRRSAGLPFMIQALVTTELQVQGNPKCFHQCMTTLLRLARAPDTSMRQTETAIETRTHSINILRALFRNSALDESVAGYVGEGLVVTLEGFEGGTWMERNSSTLLFSALMVRIFGVQRSKDSENLCVRNRMTGRIFFLRYPHLYDFMLNKLKEVSCSEDTQVLRPSLYPILLLLARLYPSSLEGTISNLKLVAYIPHVLACARSGVLKTRQLAAKAMVPLISPEQYIQHLESMLPLICNQDIKRNFCHGILLQLIRLIDSKPESLTIEVDAATRLSVAISNTYWILEQATSTGRTPCYLLADEYVKMINLVLWRFPSLMSKETVNAIEILLENLLFTEDNVSIINSGRDICLANALYLYLIILNSHYKEDLSKLCVIVCKSLKHKSYEVTLAILNFLLILYDNLEIDNKFEEHLSLIANKDVLKQFSGNPKYVETLCEVLKSNKYLECTQKALKVLALEKDTEKCVVQAKNKDKLTNITDDMILQTLLNCINEEHENLTHIYLESLSNFINKKLNSSSAKVTVILEVIRLILACSSSDNSENTRKVVVSFLENNIRELFMLDLGDLTEEEKFEYKATLYATLVTVLEDDDEDIRQRTSNVIMSLRNNVTSHTYDVTPVNTKVISTKAAEVLRDLIVEEENSLVLFVVLALLDFKSEVCMTDEVNDECRVFDHNERYNIFLEETVWTSECADKIIHLYGTRTDPMNLIQNLLQDNIYRKTIEKLCNNNFILFEKIACDFDSFKNSAINPKIGLFVDRLKK